MQAMSPAQLRQLWKTINNAPSNEIAKLNDVDLVDWLTQQFEQDRSLAAKELTMLKKYLQSRLQLIRDVVLD